MGAEQNGTAVHPEQHQVISNQHIENFLMEQIPAKASSYNIPELQKLIKKAFKDLRSNDPMGKRLYLNQILNFILTWLHQTMMKGTTLYDAQKIVRQDLQRACKEYPISKVEQLETNVKSIDSKPRPDLFADVVNKTTQAFIDRIKELCHRSKQVSYEFNKQMQLILEKDGGYKFIAGYKFTGTKAYLRIMTKVLDNFLSEEEQSKQVYTDLDHYYYTPVFRYFNTIIKKNPNKLTIQLYDWIRCKCFFKNIQDLERAYDRLNKEHGSNIFRVKNRINHNTRDILINLKYRTQYTQIQLTLDCDGLNYQFQHKLYELTREKFGIAYSCFTFMMHDSGDGHHNTAGVMTNLGYLKRALLREKVDPGFERLTLADAKNITEDIKGLLGTWTITALKTGYAAGSGYQKLLNTQSYGLDIQDMLVIKKRSKDRVQNWLNWMD